MDIEFVVAVLNAIFTRTNGNQKAKGTEVRNFIRRENFARVGQFLHFILLTRKGWLLIGLILAACAVFIRTSFYQQLINPTTQIQLPAEILPTEFGSGEWQTTYTVVDNQQLAWVYIGFPNGQFNFFRFDDEGKLIHVGSRTYEDGVQYPLTSGRECKFIAHQSGWNCY